MKREKGGGGKEWGKKKTFCFYRCSPVLSHSSRPHMTSAKIESCDTVFSRFYVLTLCQALC